MGFADQQLQLQVPYSPDDTFNALKAAMEKLSKEKLIVHRPQQEQLQPRLA